MFDTLEMSLTVLEQLAPLEPKLRQRRKSLADEVGRAAESIALDVSEAPPTEHCLRTSRARNMGCDLDTRRPHGHHTWPAPRRCSSRQTRPRGVPRARPR
ncbi:MAG TPA: hypothetical protein VFT22_06440 [Kofleriaceae bacterium]|nr:hypothetical protein [Kofleriaceae bacterium]